ncbi:ABC transporter substrate-binding protein [Marinobacterium aestuarii]|uniref:ABC transporter substrate-binding protein n=1 Tax=Marinobacterium aestuarii TaxID=1821621 RepID=A0A1A9F0Y4_9GAMM|nr:sialic acid TRAP transporter substrate-binding protein SiaP [Marinobacterium aestuarii]ANG63817.1 ABC transporter substrate-binding protein [Marinobacterium aestuarii]
MKMRKGLFTAVLLAATAVSGLVGAGEKVRWAHVYEPSEPYHQWSEWAAQEINKRSNGRFEVEVFPASTLGKEVDLNQGLTLGTIDIIYTGQSFAAQTYGPLALSDAPYVFRDFDHWQKYTRSDLFAEFAEGYRQASGGNVILGDAYYGLRHVTSNKPITKPADMEGLKIRVPNAPMYRLFPEAAGAHTSPIAFAEVYLALQQGVVDAQENPLPTIKAKKFYEVQKYIDLTGHVTGSNLLVAGGIFWNRLSEEDRELFRSVAQESADRVSADIAKSEAELVEWFRGEGVEVLEVDRAAFRAVTLPLLNGEVATWTQDQFDRLQAIR